jgi:hypothetical protein
MLIRANLDSLLQALALVEGIDDQAYGEAPPRLPNHKVGAHLRHIIEFYECFLDGVEDGHIDYDSRRRDETIQTSRQAAVARIRSIIFRLENTAALRSDRILWVRMEDAAAHAGMDPFLTSSPGRELQVLSSHTIHHFALIAVTLIAHGIQPDPRFGMAPSTLRHLEKRAQATEAA